MSHPIHTMVAQIRIALSTKLTRRDHETTCTYHSTIGN